MKIVLLIIAILAISEAQVLGIDFGTQFWKASLISPGKNLVIVENSRSGRKTINGIAFGQGVRHFEQEALYKRLKKPQMSYFYLNKLLRSLDFENPLQGYQFQNGTYYITHEQERISLEQLVGMILKNIKLHASHQAGSDIKDAVLSIPANWGWKSKTALINAAYIADLSILGLINQNSAAAINFAITRNDTDAINIGFFNLGSHNLQFSIIQFFGYKDQQKGKNIESLRVLSHVVVSDVGGLQVDRAIADHLSQQFLKKHKLDPRTKQRSYVKLLHQAAQAKQTLSANKQAQVYVQGIMDGIDLNLPISRQVVENLEVFKNLHKHLDEALQEAKLSKSQLSCVQMIGGASRIPLVSKIVKDHFDGVEVGSHINGDQAMAFGASLRAANLSIAFRVKQLHFYDGFQKDIRCVVTTLDQQNPEVLSQETLFTTQSQHGQKSILHLSPPQKQIKVDLFYGQELVKTYVSQNITSWKIFKQLEQAFKGNSGSLGTNMTTHPNLVLGFVLSTTNIVDLKQSYVNMTFNKTQFKMVDDWVEEQVKQQNSTETQNQQKKEQTANDRKQQQNQSEQAKQQQNQSGKSQQKEQTKEQEKKQTTTQEKQEAKTQQKEQATKPEAQNQQEPSNSTNTSNDNQNKTQSAGKKTKKPKAPRKKLVKQSKPVIQHKLQNKKHNVPTQQKFVKYPKFTKQQIQNNKKTLSKFEKNQKYIKQKAKIRNDLQSTLYRLKDSYEEPFLSKFSKQHQLQNLKKVVSQKLQWLDQNAWTAQKDEFQKQYNHVIEAYSPMFNRSNEYHERQKKYNQTINYMSFTYQKTLQLNNTNSWLGQKIDAHLKKINQTVEGIISKLKKQQQRPLNQNPLIYNQEMIALAEKLRDQYYLMKMIPRPKAPKKPKVEQEKEQAQKPTQQTSNKDNQEQKSEKTASQQQQSQQAQQQTSNQNSEQNKEDTTKQDSQTQPQDDL